MGRILIAIMTLSFAFGSQAAAQNSAGVELGAYGVFDRCIDRALTGSPVDRRSLLRDLGADEASVVSGAGLIGDVQVILSGDPFSCSIMVMSPEMDEHLAFVNATAADLVETEQAGCEAAVTGSPGERGQFCVIEDVPSADGSVFSFFIILPADASMPLIVLAVAPIERQASDGTLTTYLEN